MTGNRQSGRTTEQLRFALFNKAIYVVHAEVMRTYARRLLFQKLNEDPESIRIEVLRPGLYYKLPPKSEVVLDHAIFDVELSESKYDELAELRNTHHVY